MTFFSKNLKFLRNSKGLRQGKLGEDIGVKANTISNYESGVSEPDFKILEKLIKILDVSANEMLFVDLGAVSVDAKRFADVKQSLKPTILAINEAAQNVSLNVSPSVSLKAKKGIKSDLKDHEIPNISMVREEDIPVYGSKSRAIPILDARAAAGWPYTIDGSGFLDQRPTLSLPFGWFQSGEYVLIQIEGDSMHPTIYNGDWAFVRKIEKISEIKDGYVHVVLTREGIVCKRVLNRSAKGHLALQSDNSAYPTYTVPLDEILSIWKVEMKMSAILRNENLDIIKRLSGVEADIAELKLKKK